MKNGEKRHSQKNASESRDPFQMRFSRIYYADINVLLF